MILIIGASGRLGGIVARRLLADGQPVRALSRTPAKLAALSSAGAEVLAGDLRDPDSLRRACEGVEAIFSAAHGFTGTGGDSPLSSSRMRSSETPACVHLRICSSCSTCFGV